MAHHADGAPAPDPDGTPTTPSPAGGAPVAGHSAEAILEELARPSDEVQALMAETDRQRAAAGAEPDAGPAVRASKPDEAPGSLTERSLAEAARREAQSLTHAPTPWKEAMGELAQIHRELSAMGVEWEVPIVSARLMVGRDAHADRVYPAVIQIAPLWNAALRPPGLTPRLGLCSIAGTRALQPFETGTQLHLLVKEGRRAEAALEQQRRAGGPDQESEGERAARAAKKKATLSNPLENAILIRDLAAPLKRYAAAQDALTALDQALAPLQEALRDAQRRPEAPARQASAHHSDLAQAPGVPITALIWPLVTGVLGSAGLLAPGVTDLLPPLLMAASALGVVVALTAPAWPAWPRPARSAHSARLAAPQTIAPAPPSALTLAQQALQAAEQAQAGERQDAEAQERQALLECWQVCHEALDALLSHPPRG